MRKFCTLPNNIQCQCDPEFSDCEKLTKERTQKEDVPVPMYERGDL